MYSDSDIRKALDKEIVIYPFDEKDLTPVGYNLNPSDFVFSINSKKIIAANNGYYDIAAHDTVLILTKEAIWVSKKIAGTFHSKVGVVSQGFGHISTTLDPNWHGPLLISLNNPTDNMLKLPVNKSFVTLVLYRVTTPAEKQHDNRASRVDILGKISEDMLEQDLNESNKKFLQKTQGIFLNDDVYDEFTTKYNLLIDKSKRPILEAINRYTAINKKHNYKYKALVMLQWSLALGIVLRIIFFSSYFDDVAWIQYYRCVVDKSFAGTMLAIWISIFTARKVVKEE